MKHLLFGSLPILVTDAVADAVMEHALALAQSGTADSVDVPAATNDGSPVTITILLAPAVPIAICEPPDDVPEVDLETDREGLRLLEDLRWRTTALRFIADTDPETNHPQQLRHSPTRPSSEQATGAREDSNACPTRPEPSPEDDSTTRSAPTRHTGRADPRRITPAPTAVTPTDACGHVVRSDAARTTLSSGALLCVLAAVTWALSLTVPAILLLLIGIPLLIGGALLARTGRPVVLAEEHPAVVPRTAPLAAPPPTVDLRPFRRLTRAVFHARSRVERAEILVSVVQAVVVAAASSASRRLSPEDRAAESAELEHILAAARSHLSAARHRA